MFEQKRSLSSRAYDRSFIDVLVEELLWSGRSAMIDDLLASTQAASPHPTVLMRSDSRKQDDGIGFPRFTAIGGERLNESARLWRDVLEEVKNLDFLP